jgi:hypothetical protein
MERRLRCLFITERVSAVHSQCINGETFSTAKRSESCELENNVEKKGVWPILKAPDANQKFSFNVERKSMKKSQYCWLFRQRFEVTTSEYRLIYELTTSICSSLLGGVSSRVAVMLGGVSSKESHDWEESQVG